MRDDADCEDVVISIVRELVNAIPEIGTAAGVEIEREDPLR